MVYHEALHAVVWFLRIEKWVSIVRKGCTATKCVIVVMSCTYIQPFFLFFFFFSIFSPKSYGLSGKMCSNKVKITSKNNFLGQRSIQKREQKKKYTWFNWIRYVWQAFIFRKNKVSKPLRGKVLYINLFDVHWDSCNMNVIVVDCVCKIMFDGIYGILRTLRTILFISFHWWMNQRLLFQ